MRSLLIPVLLLAASALAQERQITVEKFEAPTYPPIARAARIGGPVILFLRLNKDGSVASVRVGSGYPLLVAPSIESAKKWHFRCWNCAWPEGYEHKLVFEYVFDCPENDKIHSAVFYRFKFPDSVEICSCNPVVQTMTETTRDPVMRKPPWPWSF